jgi:hypothetical protein
MKFLIRFITVMVVSMAVFAGLLLPLVENINSLAAVAVASAGSVLAMVFTDILVYKKLA